MIIKKSLNEETVVSWVEATPAQQRLNRARMAKENKQRGIDSIREAAVFNHGGRSGHKDLTTQRKESRDV